MNESQRTLGLIGEGTKGALKPVLALLAIMWLSEIVDWLLFDGALNRLGIAPRQAAGLRGIPLAPFLHGSFAHLVANTLPFLVLGFLVILRHRHRFALVTVAIVLISGLGTWLVAPAQTIHIGASGLIFGYFAFLVVAAYYERSVEAVALALLSILLYGGLVAGILPRGDGISWQGHLFGLVGGALAARLVYRRGG
jgi:membrane associated rhomboid family serine protease